MFLESRKTSRSEPCKLTRSVHSATSILPEASVRGVAWGGEGAPELEPTDMTLQEAMLPTDADIRIVERNMLEGEE